MTLEARRDGHVLAGCGHTSTIGCLPPGSSGARYEQPQSVARELQGCYIGAFDTSATAHMYAYELTSDVSRFDVAVTDSS
jgi:hypothetical protein